MAGLVIHVPHASLAIPREVRDQFIVSDEDLAAEALASADLHTDLLAREAWPGATIIEAEVSRLVLDVERYPDDAMEVMAGAGRGMIYASRHDGSPLRRPISGAERAALQSRYYDPHWARLRAAAAGGVLIDLHSYPARKWAVEPDGDHARPEIDLGVAEGLTPPTWTAAARGCFEAAGYEVALNTPYSGVIDAGARAAMMIEIRRDMIGTPGDGTWRRLVAALRALPLLE
jgi:N-formylglutamate deformylase